MDFYIEALGLVNQDPNVNTLLDNAELVFNAADMTYSYNFSTGDLFGALAASIAEGFYADLFNSFNWDSVNDYSYQYHQQEDGSWIKDYV
jgi:hypothetical protein